MPLCSCYSTGAEQGFGAGLPSGAGFTPAICSPSKRPSGAAEPAEPGPGYLSCTNVKRTLDWIPSQSQAGLHTRLCLRASAISGQQVYITVFATAG